MYTILADKFAHNRLNAETGLQNKLEEAGWGEHDTLWLLEHNGIIVGCADVTPDDVQLEVHWLCILPEYRGKGYGRAFVEMFEDECPSAFIFGDALPASAPFWGRLGATFTGRGAQEYASGEYSGHLLPFELFL